jgi:hypothetical protein
MVACSTNRLSCSRVKDVDLERRELIVRRVACAMVIVDEPIELQAGQKFTVEGRLQTSFAVIGDLPKIRGTSEMIGSGLVVSPPIGSGGSLVTLELETGVQPPLAELRMCPQ